MECVISILEMFCRSLMFSSLSSAAAAAAGGEDDDDGTPRPGKYDVFINFRGEDTRRGITSHLHAALLEKKITTYISDRLQRGGEIGHTLLEAIEKSTTSVIIFSQNYASSTWCLDELVHMLKCKERYGQMVIPVFYDINPCDVRKQHGSYADAFAQHEKRFKDRLDKVQKWRDALTSAAHIPGFDSKNYGTEADLIKNVVNHIWTKLICESSRDLEGLVGIESRIEQIEELLGIHSHDPCIVVGIWGMGGIGKTTLAKIVFDKFSSKFEASCFLGNIRENSKQTNGLDHLEKTLLKEILKEEGPSIGSTFVRDRLSRTKVLIVLDDVSDSMQMERLVGERLQYGFGSRIILTSRDRRALTVEEGKIYKVEGLKPNDAIQLFCSRAFKNNSTPRTDYKELAKKAVDYAGGIPLALILLGTSFLNCKSKEDWEGELDNLKEFPNEKLQRVLRLSYDGLGRFEKEIFLDIACFHKGDHVNEVKERLAIRGRFAAAGIKVLVDMSLISVHLERGWETIEMHDLLQEMGRTIVKEECVEDPVRLNWLFNYKDVYHVLDSDMETPNVEAIEFNWSQIEEQPLKRANFKEASNLRLLIVDSFQRFVFNKDCKFTASLDLPDSLRYLYWRGYPLQSFPSNFSPQNLVELHMPNSQVIKELWKEDQRLVNLEVIDLHDSSYLMEVPNLSGSLKVAHINLRRCYRLVEIPWYFQHLDKLTYLNLEGCKALKYLPELPKNMEFLNLHESGIKELPESIWSHEKISYLNITDCRDLEKLPSNRCKLKVSSFIPWGCTSLGKFSELPRDISRLSMVGCLRLLSLPTNICKLTYLEELNLSRCSELEDFPEILEPMEHLKSLNLSGTAIEELHSSIEFFPALKQIQLRDCKRLSSIPENICKLKYLETLDLSDCSRFSKFPEILKPMEHLVSLSFRGTAIKMLPSSMGNLIRLHTLDLNVCKHLKVVPTSIYRLTNLKDLNLSACGELEKLPSSSVSFLSLEALILTNSGILEIPEGLVCSTSLQCLSLSGTKIRSIPATIKQASRLSQLFLVGCKRLQSLPELPVLCQVEAQGCMSLKTVSSSRTAFTQGWNKYAYLRKLFTNCLKLDNDARRNIMNEAQLGIMLVATAPSECPPWTQIEVVCPGKEIPNWFSYQNEGSSVDIKLRPDWFQTGVFGFALSAVVSGVSKPQGDLRARAYFIVKFMVESHELFNSKYFIPCCNWNDYCYDQHHVHVWNEAFRSEKVAEKCSPDVYELANEASVDFCLVDESGKPISQMVVEKCGVSMLYAEDAEKFRFELGELKIEEETRQDDDSKGGGSKDEPEASGSK